MDLRDQLAGGTAPLGQLFTALVTGPLATEALYASSGSEEQFFLNTGQAAATDQHLLTQAPTIAALLAVTGTVIASINEQVAAGHRVLDGIDGTAPLHRHRTIGQMAQARVGAAAAAVTAITAEALALLAEHAGDPVAARTGLRALTRRWARTMQKLSVLTGLGDGRVADVPVLTRTSVPGQWEDSYRRAVALLVASFAWLFEPRRTWRRTRAVPQRGYAAAVAGQLPAGLALPGRPMPVPPPLEAAASRAADLLWERVHHQGGTLFSTTDHTVYLRAVRRDGTRLFAVGDPARAYYRYHTPTEIAAWRGDIPEGIITPARTPAGAGQRLPAIRPARGEGAGARPDELVYVPNAGQLDTLAGLGLTPVGTGPTGDCFFQALRDMAAPQVAARIGVHVRDLTVNRMRTWAAAEFERQYRQNPRDFDAQFRPDQVTWQDVRYSLATMGNWLGPVGRPAAVGDHMIGVAARMFGINLWIIDETGTTFNLTTGPEAGVWVVRVADRHYLSTVPSDQPVPGVGDLITTTSLGPAGLRVLDGIQAGARALRERFNQALTQWLSGSTPWGEMLITELQQADSEFGSWLRAAADDPVVQRLNERRRLDRHQLDRFRVVVNALQRAHALYQELLGRAEAPFTASSPAIQGPATAP